jgi:hypothetical protein
VHVVQTKPNLQPGGSSDRLQRCPSASNCVTSWCTPNGPLLSGRSPFQR